MKRKTIVIGYTVFIILFFSNCAQQNDFSVLKGPYLGQNPPGMIPEIQTSLEKREIIESPDFYDSQKDLKVKIAKTLEEWFPEQLKSLNIPGAVVSVFDNNDVIWEKTYGHIGRIDLRPIDTDTLFCIRSISKSITAIAVLLAVQEGLVDLDTPIKKYLPEFSVNSKFEDNPENLITLRHLLAHRASFTHDPPIRTGVNDRNFFQKRIESISDTWLRFPVGYRFAYSNLGYDLAGYILQVRSGKPFAQYVKEKVLDPIGMRESSFDYHVYKLEKNRALGHASDNDSVLVRIPEIPSAGLFSNIRDMTKYAQFHLNNGTVNGKRILREDLFKQLHTIQFAYKDQLTGYTFGLYREVVSNTISLYHTGGGRGFRSLMIFYPQLNLGVVVLTNYNDHGLTEVQGRNIINGPIWGRFGPNPVAELNEKNLIKLENHDPRVKSILGSYGDGNDLIIRYENQILGIRLNNESFYPLTFYENKGELMGTFGKTSVISFIPQTGKQPMLLMLSSRSYNNSNLHYFAFNDSPDDKPGENKSEWRKYEGEYELIWEGVFLDTVNIAIRNGYLYYRGRKCVEHEPGLFFTNDGEAIDFRSEPPTAANLVLIKREPQSALYITK